MNPKVIMTVPTNPFRLWCYKIASSQKFDFLVLVIIALNILVMMIKWPNIDENIKLTVEITNQVFSFFFILEAIIKLVGFGKSYFIDRWNTFDFIVVLLGLIFVLLDYFAGIGGAATLFIIRSLRIGRTFKLFRKLK